MKRARRARRILVTGGGGFIGSHLVDALAAAGHRVTVLDAWEPQVHGRPARPYRHPAARYLSGDVRRQTDLRRALAGAEVVFHLAAQVGVGQSMYEIDRYVDHNVRGTGLLWEAILAGKRRPRRLVVASSMSIYGEGLYRCGRCGQVGDAARRAADLARGLWDPFCPVCGRRLAAAPTPEGKPLACTSVYAVTKRDQEEVCLAVGRAYGVPTVALRFFNVYGPRQSLRNPYTGVMAIFLSQILSGRSPTVYEDGAQTRDFIHVGEIARCGAWLVESDRLDGQAVNVGTGRATSVLAVAETLVRLCGARLAPRLLSAYRAGDVRHCYADIARLSGAGFSVRTDLEARMRELVAWARAGGWSDATARARRELVRRNLVTGVVPPARSGRTPAHAG